MRLFGFLLKNKTPKQIEYYSRFSPSPLSIKQFLDFGRNNACEKTSYMFLRKELPVRLANTMREVNLLPDKLLSRPSVRLVQTWYMQSFLDILEYETRSPEDPQVLDDFLDILIQIRNRHNDVVPTMAQGVIEYKEKYGFDPFISSNIQYFLDRFYTNRISFRMLINQHTLLFGNDTNPAHPKHIGSIDPTCNVADVVKDAYETAKMLCEQYYMAAPELEIEEFNAKAPKKNIQVVYVPSHLFHMLFELFKNSMRATVELHEGRSEGFPPIKTMVTLGKEDLSIKICDKGGGVPLRKIERLFNYMYSTAPRPNFEPSSTAAPLAGFGYGLPISRLYARYFQGDLKLYSMEGVGTDAVIYLKALSSESFERLPVFNKSAWRHYQTSPEADDWSNPSSEPRDASKYKANR
ncbi:pyruvate dehydrogenase (acetyl-transferring) kinase isozyme 3, mitochondrial [Acipenser ruthenus]|uniref:pyruvate dehydrogenase (acetyl-transferring) kinase isozyme 3, mitochondrial n=1 Tax=Acipenser ruthenus TaxID=7906 RepID=UPI00145A223E|nr:pyruvate dehydrogenase (acetyl-transferring) kinase isozyme 3, mitochondrial [Acipenser ruthenus]XP_034778759.1 pyruvate dehydrogenase (acetyl-transferring) kinase isozyme 3, mitochondrial [Acipenser ruthenus]